MADNFRAWLEARIAGEQAKGDAYADEGLHMLASACFGRAAGFREVLGRLSEFLPSLSP